MLHMMTDGCDTQPVRVDIEPVELARVVDLSERQREHGWSLRSALTRYAQREPQRVSALLEDVRRIESAIQPQLGAIAADGPALWAAVQDGDDHDGVDRRLVGMLRCMVELDRVSDGLAHWAGDPLAMPGPAPNAEVDATTAEVARRLDQLGVPREERQRPPSRR